MTTPKFSAGLWIYGPVPDRYLPSGYQTPGDLEEKLGAIAAVDGLEAVEMPYGPVLTLDNLPAVRAAVNQAGLAISSLTANVVGERKWAKGSLTSPDKAVRAEAKRLIQDAMAAAEELGVEHVNLWLGQEGFDYPFETSYSNMWEQMAEGLAECAASRPSVKLCVEYKCMEPRARNIPNSAAQALLLVQKGGRENLGVTLDIGHAIMGGENPSQSASLLHSYGSLYHLHVNDNYADWDWDMAAGVNHWWQLVEFCLCMQEIDYKGYWVLDVFPYRQEASRVNQVSIKAVRKAWAQAQALDKAMIARARAQRDAMEVFDALFSY